jgi:pilus assembly protein Flp/PilA
LYQSTLYHSTIGAAHVICHNGTRGVTKQSHFLKENFFNFDRRNTMNKLIQSAKQFMSNEEGVTAIEYGLIAFLIAVTIILAVTNVGTALQGIFTQIANAL